jgi:hypothetical protein
MDWEQRLSEMRAIAAKARQAAMEMEHKEDRAEMRRLADELELQANELEVQWRPANSN